MNLLAVAVCVIGAGSIRGDEGKGERDLAIPQWVLSVREMRERVVWASRSSRAGHPIAYATRGQMRIGLSD